MSFKFNPLTGLLDLTTPRPSAWQNIKYVDGTGGSDSTGVGSVDQPYKTIQAALNSIGSAANSTEYTAATTSRYMIKVAPGIYTENLTVPTRQYIRFDLDCAYILGNVTQSLDMTLLPSPTRTNKLVFSGTDSRSMYTGASVPLVGIDGTLTISPTGNTSGLTSLVQMHSCGVSGNITFTSDGGGYLGQLFLEDAFSLGTIQTSGVGVVVTLYATNANTSGSKGIGSINGAINLYRLMNVTFIGTIVSQGTAGGVWTDTRFGTASHNFTGMSGTYELDSISYKSYYDKVTTKGSEVISLLDNAAGDKYTPGTSADWSTVPTTTQGGLDGLAATPFSWDTIPSGKTVSVPQYRQMIVANSLTILGTLDLSSGGTLAVI